MFTKSTVDKKNLTLAIASGNPHKIQEISTIYADLDLPIVTCKDLFPEVGEIEETGSSFKENALLKVSAYPILPDTIILGEDSGIEVEGLNGAPGIYSARWAGPNPTNKDFCHKLLSELGTQTNRRAQYRAVIAIRFPDGSIKTAEGIVKGTITQEIQGKNGFGYDPIFIPEGYTKTFGNLDINTKHKISHRFHALTKIRPLLDTFIKCYS